MMERGQGELTQANTVVVGGGVGLKWQQAGKEWAQANMKVVGEGEK